MFQMLLVFAFLNNCWWAQDRFASRTVDLKDLDASLHLAPTREDLRRLNLVEQLSFHHTTPLGGPDLIFSRFSWHDEMIMSWNFWAASEGSRDVRIE